MIGSLLSLSCIPSDDAPPQHFTSLDRFTMDDVEALNNRIENILLMLNDRIFAIFKNLLSVNFSDAQTFLITFDFSSNIYLAS